ncbi:MptD family putative ECF transporter S component [Bifidobacterium apri]|uniref:Putative bacterial integral membrane protein (Trep Strep) n=1 Tax=Bifidobacterium apri TaxID=1769423 RepID=A0A6A2V8G7_9BIFI|nr:MptD family putative ECF transporter S component [Bifidobacterium apri]KAB8297451.1 putative bacterial integral membrane protein (Trep Strep) [Bifidobacterium apri]
MSTINDSNRQPSTRLAANPDDNGNPAGSANTASATSPARPESPRATATRLGPRDYITIGVYTVLYFVMISIGALITHLIPVGMPFAGFACGLLGTTPLMLLMAKSQRFGAISIMGILLALLMGAVHGNYYTVATSIIAAVLADLIATRIRTRSNGSTEAPTRSTGVTLASVSVFNLWSIGMFLPFYIGRATYLQQLTARKGAEYAGRLAGLFPAWTLPLVIVLGLLGGLLGGAIGLALLRRHFKRAGLA